MTIKRSPEWEEAYVAFEKFSEGDGLEHEISRSPVHLELEVVDVAVIAHALQGALVTMRATPAAALFDDLLKRALDAVLGEVD